MKVACTVIGSLGDIHPFLGLSLELKSRGHEVVFATSEYYRDYIEGVGIRFHPIRPNADPNDTALIEKVLDRRRGAELLHREVIFPTLEQTLEDFLPVAKQCDVFVTGVLSYFAPIAQHVTQTPWVSAMLSPMCYWSAHEPPILAPIPFLGKLKLGPTVHQFLLNGLLKISDPWADPVRELRKKYGMDPGPNPFREGYISPGLSLAMFSPLFGSPMPDWPEQVKPTGFVFYDPNTKGLSEPIVKFLQQNPDPILFTLGSTAVYQIESYFELFYRTAQTLGKPAIVLVGERGLKSFGHRSDDKLGIFDYAPYAELMPRCSAVIHQGGVGTTGQALSAGIGQIVLPSCNDQFDNAERVKRMGCGFVLPKHRLTERRLTRALRRLISNQTIAGRVKEIGGLVRQEQGAKTAASLLENYIDEIGKNNCL